jgi:acetylornithine deacetylase/succinyl-diaminopimelate desuccinylase-like protein
VLARNTLALLLTSTAFAQVPPVDWKKQEAEILRHYRGLIQIDTSNPPGNETKAAEYLKKIFDAEGIPTQVFALDPARANLVARIRGNGTKRPILILGHTDVVGVQREKWPVDPFGAIQKDGYVWGRGTADDKDIVASNLMVMLLLKRSGAKLDRDVIFLAEAGEEGTTGPGIDFMVNQHLDAINAEFALTEGGDALIENGRITQVSVATAEKIPRRARLVASGSSGHGSVPRLDNPLIHLSNAVAKVGAWETPMRLNDTTRTFFEKLAAISPADRAARYKALTNPAGTRAAQRYLAEHEPSFYSMLRTSVVPTILKAGFRSNVIPSEAEATLDIRALPDEDLPKFWDAMQKLINDPAVKIVPNTENLRPIAPPSRLDTEMYRTLERVANRIYPGAAVLPQMMTGSTDMAQLRSKGIQSYGIGSPSTLDDDTNHGAHSDVERLSEASLLKLAEFTWGAVTEMAVSK